MDTFITIRFKRKTAKRFQEFSKKQFKTHSNAMECMLDFFLYNEISPKERLLSGPVGCGKTSLMKLLPNLVPTQRKYAVMPCRNIVFAFNHLGYKTIEDYGESGVFCFDDMGVEPIGRHYGKDCNVIGEILLSRYELFLHTPLKTHGTTNLNADELEEKYGERVRSRMRELFNLIAFEQNTPDKRK